MKALNFTKYGNLYSGILFLFFTIIYGVQFPRIVSTPIGVVDSRAYPRVLLILLAAMSVALIISSVRQLIKTKDQDASPKEKIDYRCVLITFLLSGAYVIVLEPLGFLISSALYVFFQTMNLCPKEKLTPIKFAVIAIGSSIVIYVLFRHFLFLMLPGGILTGIF